MGSWATGALTSEMETATPELPSAAVPPEDSAIPEDSVPSEVTPPVSADVPGGCDPPYSATAVTPGTPFCWVVTSASPCGSLAAPKFGTLSATAVTIATMLFLIAFPSGAAPPLAPVS